MKKLIILTLPFVFLSCCQNSKNTSEKSFKYDYGVFLGIEREDLNKILDYKTVVIDAQNFEKEDVSYLKKNKQTVISYINVGAIENFRSYYDTYKGLALGPYEHWDEELWMDVSNNTWQNFIINELSVSILNSGVDGLFIDNLDVYYEYETQNIFNGVTHIMRELKKKGTPLYVNGGDTFVDKYLETYHTLDDILDGVNQETIFSKIDWETETFSRNDEEEKSFFQDYVETVSSYHKEVFLLEYTTDESLKNEIKQYCNSRQFRYYISSSLELLA